MTVTELRALTTQELQHKLDEAHQELFNLRFQWNSGRLEDHNRITVLRRDTARIQTLLRERELAALAQGEATK
ncbi:MAG TPA: 50S ribosomal protein L29 [Anaerolineae bacterium]|nr:50S ribosomal protein L29 [Anaerolineae bacterium]